MGQYWRIVNVDKMEYLDPYKLGSGAKLWEQLANVAPSKALMILVANMPEPRGGGDLGSGHEGIVGRWAGDRIIMVGDYAEKGDHPKIKTEKIYAQCGEGGKYADISEFVMPILEEELRGRFVSKGDSGLYYWEDNAKVPA